MSKPHTQFDPANPPPPLMTGEPHSFAYMTMTERVPGIIDSVLADFAEFHPAETKTALQSLRSEIINDQPLSPLNSMASDGQAWFTVWQQYQQRSWLDIPWFFAEAFFYRRLLQASGYFGWPLVAAQERPPTAADREAVSDWYRIDPFIFRKTAELESQATWQLVATTLADSTKNSPQTLETLFHYGVWGNRIDLSYTAVAESNDSSVSVEAERENILVDHGAAVVAHLQQSKQADEPVTVQFICDNAGPELLSDLILTDFLLRFEWAETVTLHVKAHPTFVSDAVEADVAASLAGLKKQKDPAMTALATRLEQFQTARRLLITAHRFWNSHQFFWQLPAELSDTLAPATLVIIKGDANYRRLLGDSVAWPETLPLSEVAPYFPAPFVALRTLKSNGIVGLAPGQAESLAQIDPDWRVNGKRGLIQGVKLSQP